MPAGASAAIRPCNSPKTGTASSPSPATRPPCKNCNNFYGPAHLLQMLRPFLQKAEKAHVLNIGSMGGYQGSSKFPGLLAYSVSKAAIATLTECLAEEWKDSGVAVNCLALGAVQTEMLAEAFPGMQAPVSSAQMGGFLSYFALQGHHFFNGKVLPVSVSTP